MESRVKYPRTYHLPWSLGATADDRVLSSVDHFKGMNIVVTEKMDGENTTLYRDGLHARSIDGVTHESQSYVRQLQGSIGHLIPEGYRICGENLFAQHSIGYSNLSSYFMVFSVWEDEKCLSWADTCEWSALLGLETVPVLYSGVYDRNIIESCFKPNREGDQQEGYVVRIFGSFMLDKFHQSVAKFVRANHVQTDKHWKIQKIIKNELITQNFKIAT